MVISDYIAPYAILPTIPNNNPLCNILFYAHITTISFIFCFNLTLLSIIVVCNDRTVVFIVYCWITCFLCHILLLKLYFWGFYRCFLAGTIANTVINYIYILHFYYHWVTSNTITMQYVRHSVSPWHVMVIAIFAIAQALRAIFLPVYITSNK